MNTEASESDAATGAATNLTQTTRSARALEDDTLQKVAATAGDASAAHAAAQAARDAWTELLHRAQTAAAGAAAL